VRVVIDTNVYISAVLFGGIPDQALEIIDKHRYLLCYSDFIISELRRTLGEKFSWENWRIEETLDYLFADAKKFNPDFIPAISRDPKDNPIIACAMSAVANVIVSGDKDLLVLKRHGTIRIINPKNFVQLPLGGVYH